MKQMIRWKGFIAFIVVFAVLAVFFMLIADGFVKKAVESTGTRIVGARVDLADTDLTFFPLGLGLSGMQITNPDEPMKNAAEIQQIRFSLNPWHLIEKKVIINEMTITGVRFNTDRRESGALTKEAPPEKSREKAEKKSGQAKGVSLPSLSVPDARTILEREELQCVKEIERLEADIKQKEQELREMVRNLPDEEKLENYRSRLNGLDDEKGVMGILGGITRAKKVKEDIQADLDRIRQAKQEVETTVQTLEKRLKEVAQAPQQDIARLKEKYAISPKGLGNLTRLVFGPAYARWMDRGLYWYEKIKPLLAKAASAKADQPPEEVPPARGEGVNVRFKEHSPRPDFFVQQADVSVLTDQGGITGSVKDIASDQTITGRPTTWSFDATSLKDIKMLAIKGALDHTNPAAAKDRLHVDANHIRLENVTISESADFPLVLDKGRLDLKVDTTIRGGDLRSDGRFALTAATFSGKPEASMSPIQSAITRALSDIPEITVDTSVRGTPENPSMTISSNADSVVQNAVAGIARRETAALEKKLRQKITARTDGRINNLTESINGLEKISRELSQRLDQGNALLAP